MDLCAELKIVLSIFVKLRKSLFGDDLPEDLLAMHMVGLGDTTIAGGYEWRSKTRPLEQRKACIPHLLWYSLVVHSHTFLQSSRYLSDSSLYCFGQSGWRLARPTRLQNYTRHMGFYSGCVIQVSGKNGRIIIAKNYKWTSSEQNLSGFLLFFFLKILAWLEIETKQAWGHPTFISSQNDILFL